MRKRAFLIAALLALAAAPMIASQAQQLDFGTQLNAAACDPSGAKLVINVVQNVSNDIDSGVAGNNWAYDDYNRHIQVWQTGESSFCAVVRYTGSFVTVPGASPQNTGTLAAGVTGTMEGGYRASITGTLKSVPDWKTKGNVGFFDYGCDAVAGTCTNRPTWYTQYFDSPNFAYQWWGWVYNAGQNGSWINSDAGNSGDITGTP